MTLQELSFQDGNSLFVDTSTNNGFMMAFNSKEVLKEYFWSKEHKHDKMLNHNFDLLKKEIDIKTLTSIVCVYGPGSFTGLRVAATFAKVLSFGLGDIPIYGLSSFYQRAYLIVKKMQNNNQNFSVLIPSIGNKFFKSDFKISQTSHTDLNSSLNIYNEHIDLSGSKEIENKKTESKNIFLSSDIDVEQLIKIYFESFKVSSPIKPHLIKSSYLDFYPLFLRRSEAEEKLKL